MAMVSFEMSAIEAFVPPACGDASDDGNLSATDALLALQTGVGAGTCPTCVCDVDGSGDTNSSDALFILQSSVGQQVDLNCQMCLPPG